MKRKGKIVIYALATTILLSGCSLSRKNEYEDTIKPMIISSQIESRIDDDVIFLSYLNLPSNEQEKEELINFITLLEGEKEVIIFESVEDTETNKIALSYCEEIFDNALTYNPMIQIYYHGSEKNEKEEKELALLYPNVTYVEESKKVEDVITKFYKANRVCGNLIMAYRDGKEKIQNFDLEEAIASTKEKMKDIDTEDILNGLEEFNQYVQNTRLFQKCEEISDKTMKALQPYVESALPKVEKAWKSLQPYIEKGADKMEEIYEDVKPELEETYEKAKEKVKSLFENKD